MPLKWLSVAEAARSLSVSESRVKQLIASGRLRAQKVGRAWVIGQTDLNRVRQRKVGRPKNNDVVEHPWRTRQDWGTPTELFAELHREFEFTIDLAASAENNLLPRYFSLRDNALNQSWRGERGFLNPPFIHTLKFVQKAFSESQDNGAVVVALLPVRTGNKVWQEYVFPHADEIRYLPGRLTFRGASHFAPFDCAVVVFRPKGTSQNA